MTQTMSDKLELIARCLRNGVEVEWKQLGFNHWNIKVNSFEDRIEIFNGSEYRAKPVKPRTLEQNQCNTLLIPLDAVELTPEVRQALIYAEVEI
jgi:hypothetical protein